MRRSELRPILQENFPRERTYLLPALHYLNHQFGFLPDWALQIVSWHLRVPASEVYGAATSYSELRIQQPGRHVVRVCTGLSCWYGGSQGLMASLQAHYDVSPDENATEVTVTLEETPCGFLCSMAPAVEVDGQWVGRASSDEILRLVSDGTK